LDTGRDPNVQTESLTNKKGQIWPGSATLETCQTFKNKDYDQDPKYWSVGLRGGSRIWEGGVPGAGWPKLPPPPAPASMREKGGGRGGLKIGQVGYQKICYF
jgi:hypothetical protein